MTTGKRLDLWHKTVRSFVQHADVGQIHKAVIIDDGSSKEDIKEMSYTFQQLLPDVDLAFLHNDLGGEFRHHHSMELFRSVTLGEEYVVHLEDDWEFVHQEDDSITWALSVLKSHDFIGQAAFHMRKKHTREAHWWVPTQDNTAEYAPSRYTTGPSVVRMSSINATGGFKRVENFEVEYGYRWAARGYVAAFHPVGFVKHIGTERSAYDLNQSKR